jgi:hypothetical protein
LNKDQRNAILQGDGFERGRADWLTAYCLLQIIAFPFQWFCVFS